MIDYHVTIVNALNSILPTHYEMALTSNTKTPCISYMEVGNAVAANGDTIGYSHLRYQIKVWGNNVADLQKYATQVDSALRALGWIRISSFEMYDPNSTMIQKVITYEALALETF